MNNTHDTTELFSVVFVNSCHTRPLYIKRCVKALCFCVVRLAVPMFIHQVVLVNKEKNFHIYNLYCFHINHVNTSDPIIIIIIYDASIALYHIK